MPVSAAPGNQALTGHSLVCVIVYDDRKWPITVRMRSLLLALWHICCGCHHCSQRMHPPQPHHNLAVTSQQTDTSPLPPFLPSSPSFPAFQVSLFWAPLSPPPPTEAAAKAKAPASDAPGPTPQPAPRSRQPALRLLHQAPHPHLPPPRPHPPLGSHRPHNSPHNRPHHRQSCPSWWPPSTRPPRPCPPQPQHLRRLCSTWRRRLV